jgi:UDP-N-acetylglucosamine diphosphorylase/glucosamine-1-phosphate N-acetyltransferase
MTSPSHCEHSALPLVVLDDGLGAFGPLTDLRAAFELRAGLGTLLERIEAAVGRRAAALLVPAPIAPLVAESTARMVNDIPACPPDASNPTAHCLVVNGRLLSAAAARVPLGEVHATADGQFVAGWMSRDAALARALPAPTHTVEARLASAPWDITTAIAASIDEDLRLAPRATRHLRPDEGHSFGNHPIAIDPTATIGPLCVIDASKGAVVIGPGVVVRPFTVLVGPCAILDGSTVAERSLIKASTVIGPHCRAGGEIGGTIFQGYSNKSHDGHLGDSFVGEWVNIGAGSDNSNLLNTYGEVIVRLETDGGLMRTGRQFWGSVIGDHVKLAIGTRLMTGTTLGTGAMIASSRSPATLVPRFSWITDAQDGPKTFRIDKFLETARAMMSRRGKSPSPAVEARLRAIHADATSKHADATSKHADATSKAAGA